MTLISFAGRIRVRPEASFHHCASEERTRDTTDLRRVCTGFSNNLKLSNLSHLGRMLLKPGWKRPLYQDSHPKEWSGSEDSVGASCPGRQGCVWLLPSAAHFAFLPFPELISQVSGLCSPLCRCEEGSYSGLGGKTDWSPGELKGGTPVHRPHPPSTGPGPRPHLLPALSLRNLFKNEFSNPAS